VIGFLLYALATLIGGLLGAQFAANINGQRPIMAALNVVGAVAFWAYIVVAMLWWTR
jgi:hypothetical protein